MSITIGIALKEDSIRGILGSVGGDGKEFGEVWEVKDRAREEESFQVVKGMLTSRDPISVIIFLGEVEKGAGNYGVVGDELTVKVDKAQK